MDQRPKCRVQNGFYCFSGACSRVASASSGTLFFILEEMCCQRTDKRKSGGQGSHRTGSSGCFAERLAVGGDVCRRSLLSGGRPVFFRYGFDKCKIHCSGCVENRGSQSCLLYRNSFAIPENPSENHKADQCNLERNENLQRENTLGNTASE